MRDISTKVNLIIDIEYRPCKMKAPVYVKIIIANFKDIDLLLDYLPFVELESLSGLSTGL